MTVERRTVLKGAAWSVPVIALAVAAPAQAAASTCEGQLYIYDPRDSDLNGGEKNNVAKMTILTGSHIEIEFLKTVGHPHVNIRRAGKGTQNYHYARTVNAGEKFTYPLDECEDPEWIQVAGNNVHYYGGGVFH